MSLQLSFSINQLEVNKPHYKYTTDVAFKHDMFENASK